MQRLRDHQRLLLKAARQRGGQMSGRGAAVAGIAHLALGVSQPTASLAFYREVIGLDGEVREEADEAAVVAELASLGVPEVGWWEEPGFASVKILDPGGYVTEYFADDRLPVSVAAVPSPQHLEQPGS